MTATSFKEAECAKARKNYERDLQELREVRTQLNRVYMTRCKRVINGRNTSAEDGQITQLLDAHAHALQRWNIARHALQRAKEAL